MTGSRSYTGLTPKHCTLCCITAFSKVKRKTPHHLACNSHVSVLSPHEIVFCRTAGYKALGQNPQSKSPVLHAAKVSNGGDIAAAASKDYSKAFAVLQQYNKAQTAMSSILLPLQTQATIPGLCPLDAAYFIAFALSAQLSCNTETLTSSLASDIEESAACHDYRHASWRSAFCRSGIPT